MPFLFVHCASSDLGRNTYTLYKNQERNRPQAMPLSTNPGGFQFKKGSRPESLLPQNQVLFKPDSQLITVYHSVQEPSTFAGAALLAVALRAVRTPLALVTASLGSFVTLPCAPCSSHISGNRAAHRTDRCYEHRGYLLTSWSYPATRSAGCRP